ncbi:MAG: hypothetical protein K2N72_05975 [Oscillospiraceae bacterium]|nr:hypothetical protein [Oscillospiraceae bacterium]
MAHKMIRSAERVIAKRYNKLLLLLNIPSVTMAGALTIISLLIIGQMEAPPELYRMFYGVLYITLLYAFTVTAVVTAKMNRSLRGHGKYSYIEILGEQMIVSEYVSSARNEGELIDYKRIWVVSLADVEQVTCTERKIIIKAKARFMEDRADWLCYDDDGQGHAEFDHWYFNTGGKQVDSVEIRDNYFYAEAAARRIIFCSERQKVREMRREEFRRRMIEVAERNKSVKGRRKKKERVFRGYDIDRNF